MSKPTTGNTERYYSLIQDPTERSADIYIFGDITSWPWLENDVSSYLLSRQIAELDVDTINVHINSYGGEVAEGWAIYNSLKDHKATINTICDGFAASIASVIFMAGDHRRMRNVSLLFVHNALCGATGNAAAHRKTADDLDKMSELSRQAYLEHVNISEEELTALLDAESWITPTEALEMGFATSVVTNAEDKGTPQQSIRRSVMQMLTAPGNQTPPAAGDPTPPKPEEHTLSTFFDALCKKGGKE